MDMRTRLALTLIVSSLPAKTVNLDKLDKIRAKLDKIRADLDLVPLNQGTVDVRDLLLSIIEGVQ